MEQTTLQKIIDQKADQIRIAIEDAIDAGAKIEKRQSASNSLRCYYIDGLYVQKYVPDDTISVVMNFKSRKIAKAFEPSTDDLEKMAEQKRRELEEIENQIKERAKE